MPRTRLYRDGVLECVDFPLEDLSELTADASATAWVDLAEADRAVLTAQLAQVAEELGLHRLAVEDAVGERQRPKLDRYESHLFVTAYDVSLDVASGAIATYEISVFVTRRVLVTVRKERPPAPAGPPGQPGSAAVMDIGEVTARWDESPDLAKHGVGFLLWGLLDVLVDHQFEVVQAMDEQIEGLEDLLFAARPRQEEVQRRSFSLRKSLVRLRHVVLPMREVVNSLMRRDLGVLDPAMGPYFQDVYDHVLRATEWTESLRDLVATVLETNLTIQGNRLNLIMKKVTSWAAIIAVPTAVTGFYGMNVPYPGFGRPLGFLVAVAVIATLSLGLYALFRWRDWL